MNRIFTVFLLLLTSTLIAQTFQVENKYEMIFRKTNSVPKSLLRSPNTYGIDAPTGFKKIQIRFEISTLSGKKELFDPNKFYLVLESDKLRIRPVDFTYHDFLYAFKSFTKLSQEPITDHRYLGYKPEIKDSFYDYKIVGYNDVDYAMDLGKDRDPFVKKTYSEPKKWSSNLIDIYVIVPENINSYQLYYGSQKLMLIELIE